MHIRRRDVLAASALPLAGAPRGMTLALHQTTSAAAGYRKSLEGYAKAGIRYVEIIPPLLEPFVKQEGLPAAKRLLSDLGLRAVSSGGVRGLWEPNPDRAKALEDLRRTAELVAGVGIDRMVCPSAAAGKYTLDDYKRAADHMREAGDVLKPYGIVAMPEFMRGSTFIGSLATALRVIRDAAHPNVRPIFDCYHFQAGLSKFEDLDLVREGEIHHVHFQDVPDLPRELLDNGTRDIPGDGVSPLVRILQKLKQKGYSGPLSVELFYPRLQQGDPYEVAMEIRAKAEGVMRRAGVL